MTRPPNIGPHTRSILSPSKASDQNGRTERCLSTETDGWKRSVSSSFVTDIDQENLPPKRAPAMRSKLDHVRTFPALTLSTPDRNRQSGAADSEQLEIDWDTPSTITKSALQPRQTNTQSQNTADNKGSDRGLYLSRKHASSISLSSATSSGSATKRARLSPAHEDHQSGDTTGSTARYRPTPECSRSSSKTSTVSHSHPADQSALLDSTVITSAEHTDAGIDDSCLSTFSEIPNSEVNLFSRINQSPSRLLGSIRDRIAHDRKSLRSVGMMSQARPTGQDAFSKTPSHPANEPQLLTQLNNQRKPGTQVPPATPSRNNFLNLLDMDLPPAPTPRSMPTITIRELETLKSGYLSQISSLKASLSGREAEVAALKRAVGDAERRVGEAHESLREETAAREHAEQETKAWEQRHLDLKSALDGAKEEYLQNEKERHDLLLRLEAAEKKIGDAEDRAEEAEQRAVETVGKVTALPSPTADPSAALYTAEQVRQQIDSKIQALSSELHSIYKKKHLTKVAGLKKGFEDKLKKSVAELRHEIAALKKTISDLQKTPPKSSSPDLSAQLADLQARYRDAQKQLEQLHAELETERATVTGLNEQIKSAQASTEILIGELEKERVEKGELVAAVDEMLLLQAELTGRGPTSPTEPASPSTPTLTALEDALPSSPFQTDLASTYILAESRSDANSHSMPFSRLPSRGPGIGHPLKFRP